MNDEYIVKIWKYAITGFVVFVLAMIGSCQTSKYRIGKAIEAGASPIAARCALASDNSTDCVLIYASEALSR